MDKLLSHAARKEGAKRRLSLMVDGENREKVLMQAKRITSGLLIRQGCHSCNDPLLLTAIKERRKQQEAIQREKDQKAKENIFSLKVQVKNTRAEHGRDPLKWTSQQCRSFLQYKKQATDSKMPSSLKNLRQRCLNWEYRPLPTSSPIRGKRDNGDNVESQANV